MDRKGRLYVAAGPNQAESPFETAEKFKGGVYILSPEGKLSISSRYPWTR